MPEKLEIEDTGFIEVKDAVERAYENRYGDDYVNHTVKGKQKFRSKIASDETIVSPSGDTVNVITSKTDVGTLSEIKQNIGINSGASGGTTSSRTSEAEQKNIEQDYQYEDSGGSSVSSSGEVDNPEGNHVTNIHEDGRVTFIPQFTKEEANYKEPFKGSSELDCENCAHYIEGGGCHVVRGEVDPEANCEEFYADIGIFAIGSSVAHEVKVNLVMWGERAGKRFEGSAAGALVTKVKEKLEDKIGERYVQFINE